MYCQYFLLKISLGKLRSPPTLTWKWFPLRIAGGEDPLKPTSPVLCPGALRGTARDSRLSKGRIQAHQTPAPCRFRWRPHQPYRTPRGCRRRTHISSPPTPLRPWGLTALHEIAKRAALRAAPFLFLSLGSYRLYFWNAILICQAA